MIVIFTVYIFSQIFKKRELSENIYNAKISTLTVQQYFKGLVINYREGATKWENCGSETLCATPPPSRQGKTFCAPLLRLDCGGFGFIW